MNMDERGAGALLSPLDEDPPGLSSVDVGRAVSVGRRRRRVRRLGGYAAVAGTTAVVLVGAAAAGTWRGGVHRAPGPAAEAGMSMAAQAPPGPGSCTIRRLPLPDGRSMALVTGGDPTGRYLLGRTYPQNMAGDSMGLHIVIWDRLRPTIVSMPGDDQSLDDINTEGVAVGTSYGSSGGTTAYYYRAGAVAKLPGGDGAQARAINDAGTIVGTMVGSRDGTPVRWRSADQAPTPLALPAGMTWGQAVGIDEDGTVVGGVGTSLADQRPYVWTADGRGHYLTIPSGIPAPSPKSTGVSAGTPKMSTIVYGIRAGWVIGRVNATAVRWNLGTGQVSQFPQFDGFAEDVNRYGWQIGLDSRGRALLVADQVPVALPDLAAHKPGNLSSIPKTLSDDGTTIGGQSNDRNDVIHAVVWTCH